MVLERIYMDINSWHGAPDELQQSILYRPLTSYFEFYFTSSCIAHVQIETRTFCRLMSAIVSYTPDSL